MDEESSASKEEGSFHLSNWKKLIYIMEEIEKNVVEDSQRPQSQNIKEETLSNSRWSWPWKIHKGKVLSSKIDTATKTIVSTTISETLDNKQNHTNDPSSEFSVFMNGFEDEKQKLSEKEYDNDGQCNGCLFESDNEIKIKSTSQSSKEDKVEVLRDLRSALGIMSNINIVAMGIVIPKNVVCTSCEEIFRESFNPNAPFRAVQMSSNCSPKMGPQEKLIISTDGDNDKETIRGKSNQNIILTNTLSSSSFPLATNKRTNYVGMCKYEDEKNIIETNKKSETLCEQNNENLDEDECETAHEFAASIKLTPPFKENDNNTSQQTLNNLYCDTKTWSKHGRTFAENSVLSLVGNEKKKKRTTESISYSYPSSTSVVTEEPRNEECSQCVSAIEDEEKHLLMQKANTKTATNIRLDHFRPFEGANDATKTQEKHPKSTKIAKSNVFLANCALKNCEKGYVSVSELEYKNRDRSLKGSDNFVKPSTFSNISNENSQGYRSIEKKFLNCIEL